MSEISQPTPVKPAWPVRRDESRQKRTGSEPEDKQKKKKLPLSRQAMGARNIHKSTITPD